MISKHFDYTKSSVARFVLNDYDNQIRNFIKVFPKDFKKVLAEKKFGEVEALQRKEL
jgi:glutamate synthase (NADPH/NADH) large chain